MKKLFTILLLSTSLYGCAIGPKTQVYTAPSNAGVQASINGAQSNVNAANKSTTDTGNSINNAQTHAQKLKQLLAQLKAQEQLSNK